MQTTQCTTSKETKISNEKTGTQKTIHHSNEGSCGETKITSEVPSENDNVIPKTSEKRPNKGEKVKTANTEKIGYVESVRPSKRNRRNIEYSDITLQLHGERKRLLLLERKNNKPL